MHFPPSEVREQRKTFEGFVDIILDDGGRENVKVTLSGYVDIVEVRTLGGLVRMDGRESWGGRFVGLSKASMAEIAGARLHLTFPNGQVRVVAALDARGSIEGTGVTPF